MDPLLEKLLNSLHTSTRSLDVDKITSAWHFAFRAHSGQFRLSGEPFIIHPTQVAITLSQWNLDTDAIVAGLLHDTVEDGVATREDIISHFGATTVLLVDGVTKITNIRLTGSAEELFAENLRKMILIMAKDLRVVLIKLADRLHNMQTLKFLPSPNQLANAKETIEIYAPLADRLGMGEIKAQLEDLSFPYLYPDEYKQFTKDSQIYYKKAEDHIEELKKSLLNLIKPHIPAAIVNIRLKHLYSAWKKLNRSGIDGDWTKLYDLVAGRILVDTIPQCYEVMGIIHQKYYLVPYLGVSDFIATPKANGYRSLHTRVFGPHGRIIEIQIRTHQMHDEAEHGIAAHWYYSQAKSTGVNDSILEKGQIFAPTDKQAWVRQLVAWQDEITDNSEYFQALKLDIFQHRELVFSPHGDVYDLPSGATPVDYAYAVHTDLGHQISGARVNGKLVSLNHPLKNGDIVEILVDKNRKKPNSEWLNFVVTTTARRRIKKSLELTKN
jgi:GTP diphosphokinase / guanosine-3',5'-bis(diphosphate) 3'-diphosphatase